MSRYPAEIAEPPVQLGRNPTTPGAAMFANRLRKNLKHLRRWATREGIDCYRLYDADLPEYAVAVDLYGDWAHVQEYAPPSTVDPVRARRRLKEVMAVVPEVLGNTGGQVVLKVRQPQRGRGPVPETGTTRVTFCEVREGGLRFLVNLTDYLDTGLFLDHRVTRGLLRELAPGETFPQPVRLHRVCYRLRGGGRRSLDDHRGPIAHLSRLGPSQPGAQRISRVRNTASSAPIAPKWLVEMSSILVIAAGAAGAPAPAHLTTSSSSMPPPFRIQRA